MKNHHPSITDSDRFSTLVEILLWRASYQPDQHAYTFLEGHGQREHRLTYAQLDQQARNIAALLQSVSAVGDRVLLLYPPGLEYITAFFGCLYAGAIAVPAYPPSSSKLLPRIQAVVADAKATVVLTNTQVLSKLQGKGEQLPGLASLRWIATDTMPTVAIRDWQPFHPSSDRLAFLQYTSGSTGTPKGVMVSHGNLMHNTEMMRGRWKATPQDRGVFWLPIFHDMGLIAGVLLPLYVGYPGILMAPTTFLQYPLYWLQTLSHYRGTITCAPNFAYDLCLRRATPEALHQLDFSAWRVAINGAEPVRGETIHHFVKTFAPYGFHEQAMMPGYGLAEGTLFVACKTVVGPATIKAFDKTQLEQKRVVEVSKDDEVARQLVGCGPADLSQQIVIVHPETMLRCQEDEIGEIWLSGPSVTQGYWQRQEETSQTFHAYLADTDEGPFLRTGDLGFYHHGDLFITGRLKDVVIIRGRNHYPQDIELTVEKSHPALRPGCGAAFSLEVHNEERLIVVQEVHRSHKGTTGIASAIRRAIAEQHEIDVYAIVLIRHGSILKTSSGKIQRRACRAAYQAGELDVLASSVLAVPSVGADAARLTRDILLATPPDERHYLLETYLMNVLSQVLEMKPERYDARSQINTLGMSSLKAAELVNRIEADLGVVLPLTGFLGEGDFGWLVSEIFHQLTQTHLDGTLPSLTSSQDNRIEAPLSFAQEQLWFLNQLASDNPFYHVVLALHLEGKLHLAALQQSFATIMQRHESLRTAYTIKDDHPIQRINPATSIPLPVIDLNDLPMDERLTEAQRQMAAESKQPFDLSSGILLRVLLLRLGAEEHLLLLTLHHIAVDGQSISVLMRELGTFYNAFCTQSQVLLPLAPVRYIDYVNWQRQALQGEVLDVQLAYWKEQLKALPVLELPITQIRPLVQSYRGATYSFILSQKMSQALATVSAQEGVTLFMLLLAAFKVLLMRYSGQEDIVVGIPIAHRTRAGLEGLIGFCVNMLVLRTDLAGNLSFRDLLKRVREVCLSAYAHHDLPYRRLVEELHPERDLSRNPLFQVLFDLQDDPLNLLDMAGLRVQPHQIDTATAKFDLALSMVKSKRGLTGMLEYNTDLFDEGMIRRIAQHFSILLEGITANPDMSLTTLPLLNKEELHLQLAQWNAQTQEYPYEENLHTLFEEQVELNGDTIALVSQEHHLTYDTLNRRANQLALHLQHQGVGPDVSVGLYLERSIGLITSILAVVKAGGVYLSLDVAYPEERIAFMIRDANVKVILTQSRLQQTLPTNTATVVCLDTDERLIAQQRDENLTAPTHSDTLVYAVYTSGSTGHPKGIAMQQGALVNLVLWHLYDAQLPGATRTLQFAPVSFDVSFQEIFSTFCAGGTLILVAEETRSNPEALLQVLQDESVERAFLPVIMLRLLAEQAIQQEKLPGALRDVITAGEQLQITEAIRSLFLQLPAARLHNHYGPSETHVTTFFPLEANPEDWPVFPSIGMPLPNHIMYVLDRHLQPVPVGVPGELYIGGVGVARGYLHKPDLTAERFVPDHFGNTAGSRLFRTGDIVRFNENGTLQFMGRSDYQVKVRGYRVEPAEIEIILEQHPAVQKCVVLVREIHPGDRRLVAYIAASQQWLTEAAASSHDEETPLGQDQSSADLLAREETTGGVIRHLRAFLQEKVPAYMIPSHFVLMQALPTTSSNKVDRRALSALELVGGGETEEFVAPRTPIEEILAAIWTQFLGSDRVGIHDNFFALGGHSLLAAQIVARIRTNFQVELPLRSLLETPTIAGIARQISSSLRLAESPKLAPLVEVTRDGPLPLSFAQQRLWFLDQLEPGNTAYNIYYGIRLTGTLDIPILEQSIREIVQRHESLRTTFAWQDHSPIQLIASSFPTALPVVDLTKLPHSERDVQLRRRMYTMLIAPFDLNHGPLWRMALLRTSDGEHVLVVVVHHIIFDGHSIEIFLQELSHYYEMFVAGNVSPLPLPPIQYADVAHWQQSWLQGNELERQLVYWRRQLAGSPGSLNLPTDYPRPAVQRYDGAVHIHRLPVSLARQLRLLSQREQVTLFMTLLASFATLLSRYSGQEDILIGSPVANRTHTELEPLIGLFVNTLVLRTDLSDQPSFREVLGRVREMTLSAYTHQDLPFERVVDDLQPERTLGHAPLFQVMFMLQEQTKDERKLEHSQLTMHLLEPESVQAKFDVTLLVREDTQGLCCLWEYRSDLFAAETIARMAEHFQVLLEGIVTRPDQSVIALPLLRQAERQQLLVEWNATHEDSSHNLCLHELFAAQVLRTPDRVALVDEEHHLTYHTLDRYANQVAHYLLAQGARLDCPIGVCIERSSTLVIGILGILKAGGAYLPLDPSNPKERNAFMLADAQISLLLTLQHHCSHLPSTSQLLCLDTSWELIAQQRIDAPYREVLADNLAYVIYTSGSTGKPKGVMISHRNVANYLLWATDYYRTSSGYGSLLHSPLSFDLTVTSLFAPLLVGQRVVIVPEGNEAEVLGEQLQQANQFSLVKLTPAHLNLLNQSFALQEAPHAANVLVIGGEALLSEHIAWWQTYAPATRLINEYGPTEATVGCCIYEIPSSERHAGSIPIGRPIANTQLYVLDACYQPVPVGVPGELYIGGKGLARGYCNRPDMTAERFIANPFSQQPGERLYKTGDIVRYRANGVLEFIGRTDEQVKVRGYRIELGEIEATLRQHLAVQACAVILREDQPGDQRLVAYIVATANQEARSEQWDRFLRERLPGYMLPAAYVLLETLPLTTNGKIDRQALPAPNNYGNETGRSYVAPQTKVEAQLVAIWESVLGRERLSTHDDFFKAGGHSLLAVRIISQMRQIFQLEIPLRLFFERSTVVEFAQYIENLYWMQHRSVLSGSDDVFVDQEEGVI